VKDWSGVHRVQIPSLQGVNQHTGAYDAKSRGSKDSGVFHGYMTITDNVEETS